MVIYVIMLSTLFAVYATSSQIGSADKMFDLLRTAAQLHPVEGNAEGSYLTMRSQGGGYIGLIFFGAGFAAAVDSQLFQKAIAANPASTLGGYLRKWTSSSFQELSLTSLSRWYMLVYDTFRACINFRPGCCCSGTPTLVPYLSKPHERL